MLQLKVELKAAQEEIQMLKELIKSHDLAVPQMPAVPRIVETAEEGTPSL